MQSPIFYIYKIRGFNMMYNQRSIGYTIIVAQIPLPRCCGSVPPKHLSGVGTYGFSVSPHFFYPYFLQVVNNIKR